MRVESSKLSSVSTLYFIFAFVINRESNSAFNIVLSSHVKDRTDIFHSFDNLSSNSRRNNSTIIASSHVDSYTSFYDFAFTNIGCESTRFFLEISLCFRRCRSLFTISQSFGGIKHAHSIIDILDFLAHSFVGGFLLLIKSTFFFFALRKQLINFFHQFIAFFQ